MKSHEDRLAGVAPGRAPPAAMKHAGNSSYDSVTSQFELEFAGLDLVANPPPSQRRRALAEAFLQEQQTSPPRASDARAAPSLTAATLGISCWVTTAAAPPHNIVAVSESWVALWGYSAEEAAGRPVSLLNAPGHDTAAARKLMANFFETGRAIGRVTNRAKGGGWYAHDLLLTASADDPNLLCGFSSNIVPVDEPPSPPGPAVPAVERPVYDHLLDEAAKRWGRSEARPIPGAAADGGEGDGDGGRSASPRHRRTAPPPARPGGRVHGGMPVFDSLSSPPPSAKVGAPTRASSGFALARSRSSPLRSPSRERARSVSPLSGGGATQVPTSPDMLEPLRLRPRPRSPNRSPRRVQALQRAKLAGGTRYRPPADLSPQAPPPRLGGGSREKATSSDVTPVASPAASPEAEKPPKATPVPVARTFNTP